MIVDTIDTFAVYTDYSLVLIKELKSANIDVPSTYADWIIGMIKQYVLDCQVMLRRGGEEHDAALVCINTLLTIARGHVGLLGRDDELTELATILLRTYKIYEQ